ncbi:hypothetical protein [Streptomyces cavernae]|uniref:hypothetical protein n=1 Tax=Streptomyces cavernae TaxID=2259034 RepID=UPI000FEBBD57|nr:hypothetical protein [Streptomyces cavernae]
MNATIAPELVFSAVAGLGNWTRTGVELTAEVDYRSYTWTVVISPSTSGELPTARIAGRSASGSTEPLDITAPLRTTLDLMDAAADALGY